MSRMQRPFGILSFVVGLAVGLPTARAEEVTVDSATAARYLLGCQKSNGAFGPVNQEYTDLAWTYPAVHGLRLLGTDVSRSRDCLSNSQMDTWRFPYWDFYNRTHLHLLLGAEPPDKLAPTVSLQFKPIGKQHWVPEFTIGETIVTYHDLTSLWQVIASLKERQVGIVNPEEALTFVRRHQGPAGDFGGHLLSTSEAVLIHALLGAEVPRGKECLEWLQACQDPSGGFRWHPTDRSPSNLPDVYYTLQAIRAIAALKATPRDGEACIRWINELQNADGGFGDRPGWPSRIASTYYAIHSLDILTGAAPKGINSKRRTVQAPAEIPAGRYSIFQAHHKSPKGRPEMIEAVRSLRLDLIAVKGTYDEVQSLRDYVKSKGYKLEVVACPENYKHRLALPDIPDGNHISNFIIPPDLDNRQRSIFEAVNRAGEQGLTWPLFQQQVIAPMLAMDTLFYPEHDYGIAHAYRMYDDGLNGGMGYNAIHASHFGGKRPDWIRLYPYRERWLGQLPFLADGDAHGDIVRWTPELNRSRVLYLAREPGLAGYLDASRNGRSACVLRDTSVPSGIVYYGPPAVVRYFEGESVRLAVVALTANGETIRSCRGRFGRSTW